MSATHFWWDRVFRTAIGLREAVPRDGRELNAGGDRRSLPFVGDERDGSRPGAADRGAPDSGGAKGNIMVR